MKINPSEHYEELHNKKIIKIIQRISEIICLSVPDLYNYSGLPVIYIFYSILISLILVGLSIYTLYYKIFYFYRNIIITASILDSVTIISVTITNLISISFAIIFHRKKIVQIVKNLKEIEKVLNEKLDVKCQINDNGLITSFILLEILIFSYIIFDTLSHIWTHGSFLYSLSIIMHVNIFLMSVTVTHVQLYATCIKQYFKIANNLLAVKMQFEKNLSQKEKNGNVKMIFFLRTYDKLCDIIDLVNTSYGIQIACVTFVIIVCLIESMNVLMKFALRIETMDGIWSITLLTADTWNSVIYIVSYFL